MPICLPRPTKGFLGLCWFSALRIIRGLERGINGVVDKKDRNTSSDRLLFVYVSFVLSQRHGGDYVFVAKVLFLENTKLQKLPSTYTDLYIKAICFFGMKKIDYIIYCKSMISRKNKITEISINFN